MTVVPHGRFLKIVDSGGVVTMPTPIYARGAPVPEEDRYVTRSIGSRTCRADEIEHAAHQVQEQGRRHHGLLAGPTAHHHRHRLATSGA